MFGKKISMRQIIISIIGVAIIGLGYLGMKWMADTEKPVRQKEERALPIVFTQEVKNTATPITVTASGNLAARDRIEIFSEVQGIFEYSARSFKPGVRYESGAVLLQINSDELRANLRAQKSSLYNLMVTLLPDLRFDYPDAFQKWKDYISAFEVNQTLRALPQTTTEKEKLFIAGRNINTTWYNVKNIEERLMKYTIYAPYNGVLTEALVDKGALVRAGQKLGEFINPNLYELEVAVNSSYADLLKTGSSVTLQNIEKTKSWNGKVNRINSLINPTTQTIQAFIQVNGSGLREGMYLEATLNAKQEENTFEIPRKLLAENNSVYILDGDRLVLKEIEPVHFTEKTAVIRGLNDGTEILIRTLPGAYDGMEVKRFEK